MNGNVAVANATVQSVHKWFFFQTINKKELKLWSPTLLNVTILRHCVVAMILELLEQAL